MSADSPKIKTTRSSLRQSLKLTSVGKALGFTPDANRSDCGKEGKEVKNAKKTKETASRRNSALYTLQTQPTAPRLSMGDSKPPSIRTATPEGNTISRRRISASHQRSAAGSSDEQPTVAPTGNKATEAVSPALPTTLSGRVATLRPRTANATSGSALPKYRPKSVVVEQTTKPPSPAPRVGTRRRLSTSDDEKKEQQNKPVIAITSPAEKNQRPISPLPQRAALKANLTNSLNVSPHSSPTKPKPPTPGSMKTSSPSRPTKIVKTSATNSRPPSSSSSLQSGGPKSSTPNGSTPKTSGLKAKLGLSSKTAPATPTNAAFSPLSRDTPSPLAHRTRPSSFKTMGSSSSKISSTSASGAGNAGNMSHISEANSEDEDDEDIELLLAPVADAGAPTPAMPRIQPGRKRLVPQTPTRSNLPIRAELSYVSPFPPTTADNSTSSTGRNSTHASTSSLRLRLPARINNEKVMRGSIMSWEQLANETSVTLGEDEFGRMLSEIPAPFRSGAVSPSLTSSIGPSGGLASMPGSPLLLSTALDSPGGYGSISQVLLPDVTPSPAPYFHSSARFSLSPDAGAQEAAAATMLRLQLAAAENAARERLEQVRALEEELHELANASARQAEEAASQIAYMEAQWCAGESAAGTQGVKGLEARMREMCIAHEGDMKEAVSHTWAEAEARCSAAIEKEKHRSAVHAAARLAETAWGAVKGSCEAEVDVVRDDRVVLALLLGQLSQLASTLI